MAGDSDNEHKYCVSCETSTYCIPESASHNFEKIIGLFHVKLCAQILIARRGYSIIFL